jgi:hypothetical protein
MGYSHREWLLFWELMVHGKILRNKYGKLFGARWCKALNVSLIADSYLGSWNEFLAIRANGELGDGI